MHFHKLRHGTHHRQGGKLEVRLQIPDITNSMTLTSLIKIRDASKGELTGEALKALLGEVPVPEGGEDGECLNWVINAVVRIICLCLPSCFQGETVCQSLTYTLQDQASIDRRALLNICRIRVEVTAGKDSV